MPAKSFKKPNASFNSQIICLTSKLVTLVSPNFFQVGRSSAVSVSQPTWVSCSPENAILRVSHPDRYLDVARARVLRLIHHLGSETENMRNYTDGYIDIKKLLLVNSPSMIRSYASNISGFGNPPVKGGDLFGGGTTSLLDRNRFQCSKICRFVRLRTDRQP